MQGLWIGQLVLLAALSCVLVSKGWWRSFPRFAAYTFFNLSSGVVEYFVFQNPRIYFYTFIVIEALAIVLGLGVVYEIFDHLFSSQQALRRLATWSFATAVILLVGLGFIVLQVHGSGLKNIGFAILKTEEAARLIEVGLLAFLFVCSGTFGLHWRQPVFGIALGLSIFTSLELILVTLRTYFGVNPSLAFNIARMLSFCLGLTVWIGYILVPERAPSASDLPDQSQLEQWNRAVMELIHQ
jgi:hypothetical protein